MRRQGFDREHTNEEVIDIFLKTFNLNNYKNQWFCDNNQIEIAYNQGNVENNQDDFYLQMNYINEFKSVLFRSTIRKSAADIKAAGQIQTLYSGSSIHKCLLLSDEPLDRYYAMNKANQINDYPVDNEDAFVEWFSRQTKDNDDPYSKNTQSQYLSAMRKAATEFSDIIAPHTKFFNIASIEELDRVRNLLVQDTRFHEFNQNRGSGELSACLSLYRLFLQESTVTINHTTSLVSRFPHNRILFGAPGTGKSFTLNNDKNELLENGGYCERVTFHPDYSYANFVGTYKPVPIKDSEGNDIITYKYVPGPFMRTYVEALKNSRTDTPKPHLLIIEEINRANVAAVFGEVFQLLDRDENGVSEYPIKASEDIKKYLSEQLGGLPNDYSEIKLPNNMLIWATMNSADQGVFPMDTAFKRRWDFTYLGIDNSEDKITGKKVILGQGNYKRIVDWNELRKAINNQLITYKVNEDKLMGAFFIAKKYIPNDEMFDTKTFTDIFKNKVLMYLFDDAAKQKHSSLFSGCQDISKNQYSKICNEFDTKGVFIFCNEISSQFIDTDVEGDT